VRGALLCAISVFASVSWAQGGPTLAPYPLKVRRAPSDFTAKTEDALQVDFRKVLRDVGVQVPNSFMLSSALSDLRRQDCDRENQCLTLLAVKADTLYAMYVSVDFDVARNVTVSGRVVRNDGQAMGEPKTITLPQGKDTFNAVAKVLLTRLMRDELKLGALPVAKPVAVKPPEVTPVVDAGVPVVAKAEPVDAGVVMTPPPPPPLEESSMKTIGYVATGVGAAGVVTGAILYGIGSGSARAIADGAIVPKSGETPEEAARSYKQALGLQPAGLVTLTLGAAAAAAGIVMVILAPSAPAKVSVMPLQGGGAFVGIEGELP